MPPTCCVIGCKYKFDKIGGKTIHRFPLTQPDVLAKWLVNIGREGWYPTKYSIICSDHFEKHCFNSKNGNRLNKDAIPTLFNDPPDLNPKVPTPNPLSTVDIILNKSQKRLQKKLAEAKERSDVLRKKLVFKQRKIRRLEKLVKSLNEKVDNLKEDVSGSEDVSSLLKKSFTGVPLDLYLRMLKNKTIQGKFTKETYPPSIRTFAVTLHLYSSLAYDYVRSIFDSALPHPSAIRQWYSSVVEEPAFSKEDFRTVKDGNDTSNRQENSENRQENSENTPENSVNMQENSVNMQENSVNMQESSENTMESCEIRQENHENRQTTSDPNFKILYDCLHYC